MQYARLGATGLQVSRICLGCMSFGDPERGTHPWSMPEEQSRPFIKKALEAGITFFDTANSYSDGSSEEIVGKALQDFAEREDYALATKDQHLDDAMAAVDLQLSDEEIARLEEPYTPRLPGGFA